MKKLDRTGERRVMNSGIVAEILTYRTARDIDILFPEYGAIKYNAYYDNFKRGKVYCPPIFEYKKDYVRCFYPETGFDFIVDKQDLHIVKRHGWTDTKGYPTSGPRREILSRVIMNAPSDMEVDHINGNPRDNRRNNLRLCTKSENCCNKPKNKGNTSKYKGVCWHKKREKWFVQISYNKKHFNIGHFDDEKEAAMAYNNAAKEFHGAFARLNKIEV